MPELKKSCFYGVDISKPAVKCAAKKDKKSCWLIGNVMQKLPVVDNSMDCVLSILAPRHIQEISRVLKPNGVVVVGIPGDNHLIELRKLLLAEDKSFQSKEQKEIEKFSPFFEHFKTKEVEYSVMLNNVQLTHLVKMTPMYWKASKTVIETILKQEELTITVNLKLLLLKPLYVNKLFCQDK
jgi:23S rRNA (guanine745-N1)-methyltransferase